MCHAVEMCGPPLAVREFLFSGLAVLVIPGEVVFRIQHNTFIPAEHHSSTTLHFIDFDMRRHALRSLGLAFFNFPPK